MRKINTHENQLTLPFGEGRAIALSYESRTSFFWSLISLSAFSLIAYIYAINATAHHIAVRENLEEKVSNIESELGSLEFAYIDLKNNVSIDTARELGFKEVSKPLYVSRQAQAGSLTLNTVTR